MYTLHMIFFSKYLLFKPLEIFKVIFTNLGHFPKFEKWKPHPFSKRRKKKKKGKNLRPTWWLELKILIWSPLDGDQWPLVTIKRMWQDLGPWLVINEWWFTILVISYPDLATKCICDCRMVTKNCYIHLMAIENYYVCLMATESWLSL